MRLKFAGLSLAAALGLPGVAAAANGTLFVNHVGAVSVMTFQGTPELFVSTAAADGNASEARIRGAQLDNCMKLALYAMSNGLAFSGNVDPSVPMLNSAAAGATPPVGSTASAVLTSCTVAPASGSSGFRASNLTLPGDG